MSFQRQFGLPSPGILFLSVFVLFTCCFLQKHAVEAQESPEAEANKALKLFGRIEELNSAQGAKLPLKMEAMTPLRDQSLDQNTNLKKDDQAMLDTYPLDLRGDWSGELTIHSANFSPHFFEFDRVEANKEVILLRPGTRGVCTLTFYKGKNDRTELQPCQIVFVSNLHGTGSYTYALHLGDLQAGIGVTGNQLKSELMKNTLKQLAPGVLEQEVVSKDSDRIPSSGKVKLAYSESVLRFSKIDKRHIYLQAASVSYDNKGRFQNKIMLYGTLTRVQKN